MAETEFTPTSPERVVRWTTRVKTRPPKATPKKKGK